MKNNKLRRKKFVNAPFTDLVGLSVSGNPKSKYAPNDKYAKIADLTQVNSLKVGDIVAQYPDSGKQKKAIPLNAKDLLLLQIKRINHKEGKILFSGKPYMPNIPMSEKIERTFEEIVNSGKYWIDKE